MASSMNNILLNNFSFFENLALFGKLRRTALIRNCSNCEINSLVGVLCMAEGFGVSIRKRSLSHRLLKAFKNGPVAYEDARARLVKYQATVKLFLVKLFYQILRNALQYEYLSHPALNLQPQLVFDDNIELPS